MHKFSLYEHEVSPLMNRLGAVGEKVNWLRHVFSPRRTLLIIDMQNDFISGSLAVDGAAEIISPIADLIEQDLWNQVIYSQDWHPTDHISFFSNVDLRPLDSTWEAEHPGKVSMFEEVVFKRYPPYARTWSPSGGSSGTTCQRRAPPTATCLTPWQMFPSAMLGMRAPSPACTPTTRTMTSTCLESISSRTKKTVSISAMKTRMKTRSCCPTQFLRNTRLMRNVTTQVPNMFATPPVLIQPQTPSPVLRG